MHTRSMKSKTDASRPADLSASNANVAPDLPSVSGPPVTRSASVKSAPRAPQDALRESGATDSHRDLAAPAVLANRVASNPPVTSLPSGTCTTLVSTSVSTNLVSTSGTTGTTNQTGTTETTNQTDTTETTNANGTMETRKKQSSAPRSTASRKRLLIAKAKEELLKKEVELAAARVALLEAESEDEDIEDDDVTLRRNRTSEWVDNALVMTTEPQKDVATDMLRGEAHPTCVEPELDGANPLWDFEKTCRDGPEPALPGKKEPTIPTHNSDQQGTDKFNYKELATAITMAARAVQPIAASRIAELPTFNGASSEWLPFKVAFEESAGQLTEQENLSRLRRSLKGAARDTVQCLFVGTTTSKEVMHLLAARFGRPDALVLAELNKLRVLPRLNENPREVCVFASKVTNITATIKALNKQHYLYNAEIVRAVIDKLPATLKYRYYDYAATQPQEQPDLITLSQFLEVTADRCGSYAPIEVSTEDRREPHPHRRPARTYHTQTQPATIASACPICNQERHQPETCKLFKEADTTKRWELARNHRLCFRCLRKRKFKHSCKFKKCDINGCQYGHHHLLHSSPDREPESSHRVEEVVASARERTALLKIVPVQVSGPRGSVNTYALLDDGSTCTLIEETTAKEIGSSGPKLPFNIEGVAGTSINASESFRVEIDIRGRERQRHHISARTMKALRLSAQSITRNTVKACAHLRDIEEELVYENGRPTVLIGQDNWHLLITYDIRRGTRSQPVASLTELGWVLHGAGGLRQTSGRGTQRISHLSTPHEDEIEALMREHFALESLGIEPKRSYNDAENRALRILEEKTRLLPAGGYETGLLWKTDDPAPPSNYETALRRLEHIERKLDKNPQMKLRYEAQIQTLLDNGYAEHAPDEKPSKTWYLPHFAVINPQKPEKLRIVHDAAAKTRGVSLNDMLLPGPDLLQSLPGVLMRFRQRPVAVTADIKDMFMRVTIIEEDRDMQRFLWRGDRRTGTPTEYRMKSVIFGATSSPCTAIYVKNRNAEDFAQTHPEAASAIVNNHYVDDYLASFDTEEEAISISHQVAKIHTRANYYLQRWTSNSGAVRNEFQAYNTKRPVQLDSEKILGMVWRPEEDTLSFNLNEQRIPPDIMNCEKTPTKREALRTVMSIFDPLGIATPVTIQAKRILQDTWRTGIKWDSPLQPTEAEAWKKWMRHVQRLPELAIPRCYPNLASAKNAEIHTFVDASSSVYACAVFWRIVDAYEKVRVILIAAKGRVAPINKVTSIPRLELQAAVLGCRLTRTAIEEHELKPTRRFFWTDSRTVLSWLRNGPRVYKPFVAHRVAEITEETKTCEWRWVSTKDNVADDATRDTPSDFDTHHRWFRGPDFLYSSEEQWPQEKTEEIEETGEERVTTTREKTRIAQALPEPTRFSSWQLLLRSSARVLQFIDLLRKKEVCCVTRKRNTKKTDKDPTWKRVAKRRKSAGKSTEGSKSERSYRSIDVHYLNKAKTLWIKSIQEDAFPEDLMCLRHNRDLPSSSRLKQLSVIIDHEGILRLRSRIAAAADLTAEQREPPIVDSAHPWVRLYIIWVHRSLHHGGFETTTNEIRQHMWVLRLRHAVRSELKNCQLCRIKRATPAQPSTGDHPKTRLAHHQRAFTYTGMDYFGPMTVTVGRTRQKRYGALFTCLTTRAVHLEIAGSLSTDSAIMALRRFIGRRGCPTELWSDQGTNFKGADQELRRAAQEALQQEASVRFIKWRYIPPSAPFMGGAWERLVRSVKTALAATLNERAPREEVLATLLVEAEHTINSRPLTHVSTSPDDEDALTPNHFLLGGPSRVPLPGTFTEGDLIGHKHWRASQRLADCFWARWIKEYLPELQHRREPRATCGAIKKDDLVLIADGTLPRNAWPRGVVIATYPGPDGETRAVDVRTNRGVLRRPTKKLVILPTT